MTYKPFPDELAWVDFALELTAFVITVLNLLALYADMVNTLRRAPLEMRDCLGTLRQQICEERHALRSQTRAHRRHQRDRDRNRNRGSSSDAPVVTLPLTYSDQTLSLHYTTLHDLWVQFRALERPFLVAADDDGGARAEARAAVPWTISDLSEKAGQGGAVCESQSAASAGPDGDGDGDDDYDYDGRDDFGDWRMLYKCGFGARFAWWRCKPAAAQLGDLVQKVMLRRMEREVTQTRLMVMQLRGVGYEAEGAGHGWRTAVGMAGRGSASPDAVVAVDQVVGGLGRS